MNVGFIGLRRMGNHMARNLAEHWWLGHIEGQRCEEHERCVYQATPLPGSLRRIVQFQWQEGVTNLLE